MNYPILWRTAPLSLAFRLSHIKSNLSRAALAAAISLGMGPLALVPVRAQDAPVKQAAASDATPGAQLQVDNSPLNRSTGAITSFAPVVEKITPSIVTISTKRKVVASDRREESNPLLRFFGIPDGPNGPGGGGALGSGVIVSPDGLILTNNHVAESGDEILVKIGDHGHEYTAKVVGNDPTSDLALLRIDAKNLPVLTFADSDQVKVGDLCLAVGNPFGLTDTVTMGIVSALGRSTYEGDGQPSKAYQNFIQTDASINPGNSGGALVDVQGRLIGINSMIVSSDGGNQRIGFAIPSNLARNVIDSLLKYGKVSRGYLGILLQQLTPDLAEEFKVPADQEGALIGEVYPGSAAEKGGLQNGDIVTSVNGKTVTDGHALKLLIGGMSPGDKVTVSYLRDGQSNTAQVTLLGDGNTGEVATNSGQDDSHPNVLDGVNVGNLDDSSRADLKIPSEIKGALVTDVAPDSVGYNAGIRKGDVLLEMNRKPITGADQALAEGDKIGKDERVLLHIWTNGMTEYVVLKPKES